MLTLQALFLKVIFFCVVFLLMTFVFLFHILFSVYIDMLFFVLCSLSCALLLFLLVFFFFRYFIIHRNFFFFFKQKTAYYMRISYWSSDVCASDLVVTATRQADDALLVPAAVDVVGTEDLRRARPQLSLSESLQRVPGVVARDRQNQAQGLQVSIRGFGARASFGIRGVRLYSDGIPATMPDGQGQVSHFMLESAGRVEVLRGPFSALYGNSSGGVISVSSADPPPHPQLDRKSTRLNSSH